MDVDNDPSSEYGLILDGLEERGSLSREDDIVNVSGQDKRNENGDKTPRTWKKPIKNHQIMPSKIER